MASERGTAAGERTRERILQVALPLFAEHGFAGTSVRKVANAASVNVATLAYHFDDKAGLYAAVIARLHEEMEMVAADADKWLLTSDPLRTIVEICWKFILEHRSHVRLLHRHVLDHQRHSDEMATWMEPSFGLLMPFLSAVKPGWPEHKYRLLVFTAMHLLVRFSLEERDEVATMLAVSGDDLDRELVDWVTTLVKARVALP
jgi:AcrR family transcriptional regulator